MEWTEENEREIDTKKVFDLKGHSGNRITLMEAKRSKNEERLGFGSN
jgi:RNA binding exosome subunit